MKAIALQLTHLTKDPVDSSQAGPDRLYEVAKGEKFNIKALAMQINDRGKRLATFDREIGPAKFNTWFLFPAHWEIDGGPRSDFHEAIVPKAAHESSPIIKKSVDWWDGRNDMISQFFCEWDATNGDNRRIPVRGSDIEKAVLIMAGELDKIRIEWGEPIGVTSWHRPPAINREVGGASQSQHMTGGAADVYTLDGRDWEFEDFLDRHWGGGLGYGVASGRGFTHLDLREGKWRNGPGTIRWTY